MAAYETLCDAAMAALNAADPMDKIAISQAAATAWRDGEITLIGEAAPPDRPARLVKPELRAPSAMPKRSKANSVAGRAALLHALAHIELNAIDLAWDVIARFSPHRDVPGQERGEAADELPLTRAFFNDWVMVAADEARHHRLLQTRLKDLGTAYGDLPAHDGLWESSMDTAHDIAARLAIVPMVLEARGLDVTPSMIDSLHRHDDADSARLLQIVHDDEINHVAIGWRWFDYVCAQRGDETIPTWQTLVRKYFRGQIKRPFNTLSRLKAGMAPEMYEPLADEPKKTNVA
ncbi:MAG: ferritin-like domain-containing protein [Alphaproteobacteria bacterium]|nr:ferritin-like domain-containing protein [Alphaproteobacteria bacterium SS10]